MTREPGVEPRANRPGPASSPVSTTDRALGWIVTGPVGRGLAFAIDFVAAWGRAALIAIRTVAARDR